MHGQMCLTLSHSSLVMNKAIFLNPREIDVDLGCMHSIDFLSIFPMQQLIVLIKDGCSSSHHAV